MKRIFISYKRADKDKVFPLVKKIEQEVGEKCWVDIEGIESTSQFISKICCAIDNAEVVLFMHSSVHLYIDFENDWTIKELYYAQENHKRVQLVKLDDSPLKQIFLFEYGTKNNTDSNDPLQVNKLINDLRLWLGKPEPDQSPAAANLVNLKVLANLDCKVFIDCADKGVATANRLMKIPLAPGEYYAEFVSTKDSSNVISKEIVLNYDKIEKVDFLSLELVPYISNNKAGFANRQTQEVVIPCRYDQVRSFWNGLAFVCVDGKWGSVDKSGKEVIPCKYDDLSNEFIGGLVRVELAGRYGFVDNSGKEVVPCIYDWAFSFEDGLAGVRLAGKWGFIDTSGKEVVPCKYDDANSFSDGLASVKLAGKWGFIDTSGQEKIPFIYDSAGSFSDGLAIVRLAGRYGFVDTSGKEVVPCKYDDVADYFSEGLVCVVLDDKFGFVDTSGREVIPCKYNGASSFYYGLASVEIREDKWGYIDTSGQEVIPYKYRWASAFGLGLARVWLEGKSGYIDIFGNEMLTDN